MKFLSLFLCSFLALSPLWADSTAASSPDTNPEAVLHIHVVDDPGLAMTQSTAAKGYVVQVTDAAGTPVTGAAVALRLPEDGPTGHFPNGLRAWVAYSDQAGVARFPVIEWGDRAGAIEIHLTAAKGTSHSGFVIAQQIGPEHPSVSVVSVAVEKAAEAPAAKPEASDANIAVQKTPAAVSVPKPAAPSMPQIAVKTMPGTVSKPLADTIPMNVTPMNVSRSGSSAPTDKLHTLTPDPPSASNPAEPTVSITNSPTGAHGSHDSHTKRWLLLAAIGTGAGVGAMMAMKGHGGSSSGTASTTGVSVGTPTITVGH